MNDDFNTARAVSVLFHVASELNKAVKAVAVGGRDVALQRLYVAATNRKIVYQ